MALFLTMICLCVLPGIIALIVLLGLQLRTEEALLLKFQTDVMRGSKEKESTFQSPLLKYLEIPDED